MFSVIMIDLLIINLYWFLYWYRKEQKVKQMVGNVGYWKLQKIMLSHGENLVPSDQAPLVT